MPKKIYDIKPPKAVRKTSVRNSAAEEADEKIKEFFAEEKPRGAVRRAEKMPSRNRKKDVKNPFLSPAVIGSAVLLIVIAGFLYVKLPRADVKIWPKIETLSFEQTISADKTAGSVDITKSAMPAQYLEAEKTATEDFQATGNASNEGKASGTIIVYNKFDPPASMTLKSGTRFLSDSGKLFLTMQKIVVPAAKKSGGKITPGSIEVKVQAAEGGDSYNIAPANFSVPGLQGSAYYFAIYATSSKEMTGGYSGKVKKVTEDDIRLAKETLVKKLADQATSDMKAQISSDYILLDDGISAETISASSQTKAGTVAEKFSYQAKVKVKAVAFKKSDLDEFAKNYIISQMPEGKTLLDGSLKTEYSLKDADVAGGKLSLKFSFSSGTYKNIDKNSLGISFLGENKDQISQTIKNALGDEASRTEIKFWPFWVKSAPRNQKAVHVNLEFK